MHEARDLPCEHTLGLAGARIRGGALHEAFDLLLRQEREGLEQAFHLGVRAVDPELVEPVRAEHRGVEPHGVAFGLAEFLAVGVGDDRTGHDVHIDAAHLVDQVEARREVAPLIGSAELEHAVEIVVQVQVVVALEHLVAELGERDALLRIKAACHDVLGEHRAQTEVLAHVAQEVDDVHRRRPVVV